MIVKARILTIVMMAVLALVGCNVKSVTEEDSSNTVLIEQIYRFDKGIIGDSLSDVHSDVWFVFIKFHSDGVVEWVDMIELGLGKHPDSFSKYYGVYELDGRKLTITLSKEEPILFIVENDGQELVIGNGRSKIFNSADFTDGEGILKQFE